MFTLKTKLVKYCRSRQTVVTLNCFSPFLKFFRWYRSHLQTARAHLKKCLLLIKSNFRRVCYHYINIEEKISINMSHGIQWGFDAGSEEGDQAMLYCTMYIIAEMGARSCGPLRSRVPVQHFFHVPLCSRVPVLHSYAPVSKSVCVGVGCEIEEVWRKKPRQTDVIV